MPKNRKKKATFVTSNPRPDGIVNWARNGGRARNSSKPVVAPHSDRRRPSAANGNLRSGATHAESQPLVQVYGKLSAPATGGPNPTQPSVRVTGRTSAPALPAGPIRITGPTSADPYSGMVYQGPRYPDGSPRVDIHETPQFEAQTRAKPTKSPKPLTLDDIMERVLAAAQAAFKPITPAVANIDIGSVTAPYDQAAQVARQSAETHKGLINQLSADQTASINQWSHEDAARLVRAKAAEIAAQKEALAQANAQFKDVQKTLTNQGVDPGLVAGLAAQAQADIAGSKELGDAAIQRVEDAQGAQSAEAADRARANTTNTRDAQASLSDTLMGVITGLAGQKAQAQSAAEYQNAQNAVAAQNSVIEQRQAYMQNVQQIISDMLNRAAEARDDPTVYETPGRASVQKWISNYSRDPKNLADDVLRQALRGAPNEEVALNQLDQAIKDFQKKTKKDRNKDGDLIHPDGVQFAQQFLANQIRKFYATNGTLRASASQAALERALAQVQLLGLV